jgi:hypothetical protein
MAIEQWIFREVGNEQGLHYEQPLLDKLQLHFAASVSWHHKSKLTFYHDEHWTHEYLIEIHKKHKPRRSKKKTEAQYQHELVEWKALEPPEIKKKGNTMTQRYYCDNVLLEHIKWIHHLKQRGLPAMWLLEDGDPSHGHYLEDNPPNNARKEAMIALHKHPAQSPDLNPIEGLWLILKERLQRRYKDTLYRMSYEEFKAAIEAVWESITMDEVRDRIKDMPWRCKQLINNGGARIKGTKW